VRYAPGIRRRRAPPEAPLRHAHCTAHCNWHCPPPVGCVERARVRVRPTPDAHRRPYCSLHRRRLATTAPPGVPYQYARSEARTRVPYERTARPGSAGRGTPLSPDTRNRLSESRAQTRRTACRCIHPPADAPPSPSLPTCRVHTSRRRLSTCVKVTCMRHGSRISIRRRPHTRHSKRCNNAVVLISFIIHRTLNPQKLATQTKRATCQEADRLLESCQPPGLSSQADLT